MRKRLRLRRHAQLSFAESLLEGLVSAGSTAGLAMQRHLIRGDLEPPIIDVVNKKVGVLKLPGPRLHGTPGRQPVRGGTRDSATRLPEKRIGLGENAQEVQGPVTPLQGGCLDKGHIAARAGLQKNVKHGFLSTGRDAPTAHLDVLHSRRGSQPLRRNPTSGGQARASRPGQSDSAPEASATLSWAGRVEQADERGVATQARAAVIRHPVQRRSCEATPDAVLRQAAHPAQ